MDTENKSRADLTLPNPQEPSSVPEIELLEVSPREKPLPGKSASPQQQQAWLTVLKKELEFLGATQILIGSICLCFGILVCSALQISGVAEEIFSSFKIGYPFWGAILFIISGFLSVMSERKNAVYLDLYDDDDCYVASFVTELVMMMLFLTILGFCSAVSLTIYGIREELKVNKVAEELLYEELNIYSPIYSELEDKGES
ncbi:high affinity immunoglobulin epsilon receptor subunit beta isoform X2 [Nannospalax galili]|uniref:high affinity immunoglobulin epsilon receptor subunit beta isoform X2 n=1 Tax=Nannospalax galili TaxID=1026970 RepID=UPI0004ED30CB|nr:high affinity immunoglobulin epsilon receptor subunit beta isoform X2 [Nannospalax galili]